MFGPHIDRSYATGVGKRRPSIVDHIKIAREEAINYVGFEFKAIQIFVSGPRNSKVTLLDYEAEELRDYIGETGLELVFHGNYTDVPWKDTANHAIDSIVCELEIAKKCNSHGVVIHLGAPGLDQVAKRLPVMIEAVRDMIGEESPLIYLETPHIKKENSHYETPAKIAALVDCVREVDPHFRTFGICIDTAHLWACGCDISTYEAGRKWVDEFHEIGIQHHAVMFHINDNYGKLGTGVDKHATLLQGNIWGKYKDRPKKSGLYAFIEYIMENNFIAIFERKPPPELLHDYALIMKLT